MKFTTLLTIGLLTLATTLFAQNEANIWYFGNYAGMDFNPGPPVALTNGALTTSEGCASIADAAGNLLFYSDGKNVWNKNHVIMVNGTGLLGNASSTQSAIIVPKPGSNTIYYIFTVADFSNTDGLNYSEVDMTLDAGNGAVTANKNVFVLNPVYEKVTAVAHANNQDIWVITHEWGNDAYQAFLVTSTGVNLTPVTSNVGTALTGSPPGRACGYLKGSPQGDRLASANCGIDFFEVYDFDNATGVVSNAVYLPSPASSGTYGVEFSPNGQLLYGSNWSGSEMYQFDLNAGTATDILNTMNTYPNDVRALQLGPDGKIYGARLGGFLAVINDPDVWGPGHNYVSNGVNLLGQNSSYGLPTFIQTYFVNAAFTFANICLDDTTVFTSSVSTYDSLLWNFDDPISGSLNFADTANPIHFFADTGSYDVSLVVWYQGISDTSWQTVNIISPEVDLGSDTTLCDGEIFNADATTTGASYLWNDNSTNSTLNITQAGSYWVEITVGGCTAYDTIDVAYSPAPIIDLGNDTILCNSGTFTIDATTAGGTYLWNDNSTNATLDVTQSGTYSVEVTVNGCSSTDNITVTFNAASTVNIGNDTTLCVGGMLNLDATATGGSYLWSDNSTNPTLNIVQSGTYWVEVTVNGCSKIDSILITDSPVPTVFWPDSTLCAGTSMVLNATNQNASYLWQDLSTNATFTVTDSGFYGVEINVDNCLTYYGINISLEECESELIIPNVFSPNGDSDNDIFKPVIAIRIASLRTTIYNRWGQEVFSSNNVNIDWDGKSDGKEAPEGVYYWVIEYTDELENTESLQGFLTLFR
jgi:gliding motility-associated-like protein